MIEEIAIFIVFGAITGILSGMLGIGGGVITVPAIFYVLSYFHFPEAEVMRVAIASALASTVVTSLGATWFHHQQKAVHFEALRWIVLGLFVGCILGAFLTFYLSSDMLRGIFGTVVVVLSVYFFFPKLPPPNLGRAPNSKLTYWSVGVGCLSTLLGIGGGLFTVPILLGHQVPLRNAIATSSASTLASAFFGSILFLFLSHGSSSLPHTFGYINLPAFFSLGLSSLLTTALGTKLAHTLPTNLIKRVFACALAVTGLAMLIGHG